MDMYFLGSETENIKSNSEYIGSRVSSIMLTIVQNTMQKISSEREGRVFDTTDCIRDDTSRTI